MKRYKFLAISDTHLGHGASLLYYEAGRRRLQAELLAHLGGGERFAVEQLVLAGDVPDVCLACMNDVRVNTRAFVETIAAAADVGRWVFLPGNHDHALWTRYWTQNHGGAAYAAEPLPLAGVPAVAGGARVRNFATLDHIVNLFFHTGAERKLPDFTVANPVYAQVFQGRAYAFTHGAHFRFDVTTHAIADFLWELTSYPTAAAALLGDVKVKRGADPKPTMSLEEQEAAILPFVDSFWGNLHDVNSQPATPTQLRFATAFHDVRRGRPTPSGSRLFDWRALREGPAGVELLANKFYNHASIMQLRLYFLRPLLSAVTTLGPAGDVTLVFGDTHVGGYGEFAVHKRKIRIYNTGGWATHDDRHHPPCHLFAVAEDGTELLLDVSFRGVEAEGQSLLAAARDWAESAAGVNTPEYRKIAGAMPSDGA